MVRVATWVIGVALRVLALRFLGSEMGEIGVRGEKLWPRV